MNEHWLLVCNMDGKPVLGILRDSCKKAEDYFNGKAHKIEIDPNITDEELDELLFKEQIKYGLMEQMFDK